jgi:hypothetical protein
MEKFLNNYRHQMGKALFDRVLLVVSILFLVGCSEDSSVPQGKDGIRIIEGELGGKKLFIPADYFESGMTNFSDGTITLQVQQPEFLPLSKRPVQMWADGEQTKYVSMLVEKRRLKTGYDEYIRGRIDFYEASKVVGEEHGLLHMRQPDGQVQDRDDLWVERNRDQYVSYIACSEHITENDVPQCSHSFEVEGVNIFMHYDKRNLPDWKKIQVGVAKMIESFRSPETAREALFQKIEKFKDQNQEKSGR